MHPLKDPHATFVIRTPWAGVMVKRRGRNTLEIGEIVILKPDTIVARLPDTFEVTGPSTGEVIRSERDGFWITVESIDPYHVVCDGLPW